LVIVVLINIFLVFLLLQFIIIPYLIKVGDLPINTSLNLYTEIFSPIPPIPTYTSATSPSLPQDTDSQKRMVVYL
jgi:hypothetical protein